MNTALMIGLLMHATNPVGDGKYDLGVFSFLWPRATVVLELGRRYWQRPQQIPARRHLAYSSEARGLSSGRGGTCKYQSKLDPRRLQSRVLPPVALLHEHFVVLNTHVRLD